MLDPQIKKIIDTQWYYVVNHADKVNDYKDFLRIEAKNIWTLVDQEHGWESYFVDVSYDADSQEQTRDQTKGNHMLLLHNDAFYKSLDFRPDYVMIYVVDPGTEGGLPFICNLDDSYAELIWNIGKQAAEKLINSPIHPTKDGVQYADYEIRGFPDHIKHFYTGKIYNNGYYSVGAPLPQTSHIMPFIDCMEKSKKILPKYELGDLVIINNKTFAHGRTEILGKTRHLVKIFIKES